MNKKLYSGNKLKEKCFIGIDIEISNKIHFLVKNKTKSDITTKTHIELNGF